jgi:hypothetical protein
VKTGVIALSFALGTGALARDPDEVDAPDPVESPAEPEPEPEPESEPSEAVAGPLAVDVVLPSGLRVIVARDTTLPVASVVLALETGTEDDPADRPGLVHALGYHLLQGNRELPPEGIARIAHDGGGVTSMAVGPAQIRYESLVPVSLLDDMMLAESKRLRSPSIDATLWKDSLGWARRDARRNRALPLDALAALHGADGLGHAGRNASADVKSMVPRAVAQELAERMSYARATLVVVSPLPPSEVLDRARPLFADLPEQARQVRDRYSAPRAEAGPRRFAQPEANGSTVAWPVPPGSEELERARIFCRVINRQRRIEPEPARARLRCHLDEDPRRAVLVLRATGVDDDPLALIRARLRRIFDGEDERLLEQQRQIVTRDFALELSTPLGLSRRLATTDPRSAPTAGDTSQRPLGQLTGLHATDRSTGHDVAFAQRYSIEAGMQIVASKEP